MMPGLESYLSLSFSFLLAFAISLIICRIVERFAGKLHLLDEPGARKLQTRPVPRAGGLAIFAVCYCAEILKPGATNGLLLLAGLIIFSGGFYDDRKASNSVRMKLLFQISGVTIFFAHLLCVNQVHPLLALLAAGFTFVMINSFNLMDNMNALTAGLSLILVMAFGASGFLSLFQAFVLAGALCGFLTRNFPSGRIFLGDQGSQFLGFWMSAIAVTGLAKRFQYAANLSSNFTLAFLFLLLAFLPFICDTALVIVIRRRNGVPITRGDQNHLSHQLTRRGFSAISVPFLLGAFQIVGLGAAFTWLGFWLN